MLVYSSDFEMSVPYGAIRGKIWKNQKRPLNEDTVRVLALHGWQDNCGSFDSLLPYFPDNFYVVAIDFPGHGLSSHLPPGCPYNDLIFVIEVERIVQHLGWKTSTINNDINNCSPLTILGHSMGAAIGMFYACLYPTVVKRVIALDMVKPLTFPSNKLAEKTREGIQQFLQIESKISPITNGNSTSATISNQVPVYDHCDAVQKLITAHSVFGIITPEGAEILLRRGAKPSPLDPTKVYFTRDNRLKAMLFQRMDNDALSHYFRQLRCELLIIKAENGVKLDTQDVSKQFIDLYKETCSRFDYITIPGGHHVHLCQAENVYQSIVDFIKSSNDFNGCKNPLPSNGTKTS